MGRIKIVVASEHQLGAAQAFYAARGYGGDPITSSDFVLLAQHSDEIIGVARLCQEQNLLWLRGMQIDPSFRRQRIGTRLLERLEQEIKEEWCCCLPYSHLVDFYRQAGFEPVDADLPPALRSRLESYVSRGLDVVAMVRSHRPQPN